MGMAVSMSEINKKLNALSQKNASHSPTAMPLQAVKVKPVPKNHGPLWMVAGVCIAVIAGGAGWWFGSQSQATSQAEAPLPVEQAAAMPEREPEPNLQPQLEVSAPEIAPAGSRPEVVKSLSTPEVKSLSAKPVIKPIASPKAEAKQPPVKVKEAPKVVSKPKVAEEKTPSANVVASQPVEFSEDEQAEELMIETVELDARQLANVEYKKVQKALKSGDSRKAISYLEKALKYQPEWIKARQKLSALYYGRGDNRKAIATLQEGLALGGDQPDLRLTMAKLLVNESQQQAALNVLSRLPEQSHSGYLAMRGALAQQLKNNELAMSSYRELVKEQPYDGRWWMGLGIALERSEALEKARDAYKQALLMGRVSQQSQHFIQQRLAVLDAREG